MLALVWTIPPSSPSSLVAKSAPLIWFSSNKALIWHLHNESGTMTRVMMTSLLQIFELRVLLNKRSLCWKAETADCDSRADLFRYCSGCWYNNLHSVDGSPVAVLSFEKIVKIFCV